MEAREIGHIKGRDIAATAALAISMMMEKIKTMFNINKLEVQEEKSTSENMLIEYKLLGKFAGWVLPKVAGMTPKPLE